MNQRRNWIWLLAAFLLSLALPLSALFAPEGAKALFWRFGPDPAVAVLQGEHWGRIAQEVLLAIAPFVPVLMFCMERTALHRAKRLREHSEPPEFASEEERRSFYLRELNRERQAERGTPWIAYSALCGLGVLLFALLVIQMGLPRKIEETGRDLAQYRAGEFAVYVGALRQVERPVRDGVKQIPDERFVYYQSETGSLRCAVSLLPQPMLMQPSYTALYLPETGTVLSITDSAGNLRTGGAELEIPTPEGCWMYGDLAVPICNGVPGYETLSPEQQALFDLLYSQVFSGRVASGEVPTRSFDLPYPLEKEEFNAVLALYDASVTKEQYPNHGYRTDDGRIVRVAYCYGIIHLDH